LGMFVNTKFKTGVLSDVLSSAKEIKQQYGACIEVREVR
jgi:hypothetical protein